MSRGSLSLASRQAKNSVLSEGMSFYDDLLEALNQGLEKWYDGVPNRLAKAANAHLTTVKRVLSGERSKWLSLICRLADATGLEIRLPEAPETGKDVHFVKPEVLSAQEIKGPIDDQYMAVPMAKRPVAAGGGIIPEDKVESWILVWKGQEAVRHKSNLAVVRVDVREGASMEPTLHPGDLALIDRNDWTPKSPPGNIYLVQRPDGDEMSLAIKRAKIQTKNGQELIVFYSDNPEHGPEIYDMNTDFEGDLTRAVKGRVIWSWSDMTKK